MARHTQKAVNPQRRTGGKHTAKAMGGPRPKGTSTGHAQVKTYTRRNNTGKPGHTH